MKVNYSSSQITIEKVKDRDMTHSQTEYIKDHSRMRQAV